MLNYLEAGERPDPKLILGRMSEDGRCLLTGSTENLSYIPVDTDVQNFLPSNMACVADEIAKGIIYTYYYAAELKEWKITFDTSAEFETYNRGVLEIIEHENKDSDCSQGFSDFQFEIGCTDSDKLLKVFEFLTTKHLKGIFKIEDSKYTLDRMQYQGYVLRSLVKQQASKIVKLHRV